MLNVEEVRAVPRDELVRRLRDEAILWAAPGQPVLHRDGRPAPWAFYSWHVTHTTTGLRLAAEAMLERLRTFEATQLAGYGLTAAPLLSACVLLGGGRYTGLSIRSRRKAYLSCRQVEGRGDRRQPVVLVDDSLSSGTSASAAIAALEAEGFVVEGLLALVEFPHRGGREWLTDRGYRVECLFDIWRDVDPVPRPQAPAPPLLVPDDGAPRLPERAHPGVLARRVAETYRATGLVPRPPERLDSAYDARGGTFVSFRERATDRRLARDGFWRWDPADADPARDVVLATIETLRANPHLLGLRSLDALKIAVTFLGPLTAIEPGELDFDRYGIVVQSRVFPARVGGALPNTQVFTSEIAQYAHARDYNARLEAGEEHTLFRHTVRKLQEPDTTWPLFGQAPAEASPWSRELGEALCRRARAELSGRGVRPDLPEAADVTAVAVALHRDGLRGWGIAWSPAPLESLVDRAAAAAVRDAGEVDDAAEFTVVVSVLHDPEGIGFGQRELAAMKLRPGLDAAVASAGTSRAAVLPGALVYNNWSRDDQVAAAARLLGAPPGSTDWAVHQVAAWAGTPATARRVRYGFVDRPPRPLDDEQAIGYAHLLAGFVLRSVAPDGLPAYRLDPVSGRSEIAGTAARRIHALGALHRAGIVLEQPEWCDAARAGLVAASSRIDANGSLELPGHVNGPLADAVLLEALAQLGDPAVAAPRAGGLAARLRRLVRADGLIGDGPAQLSVPMDHRYLPGAVIAALAAWAKASGQTPPPGWLDPQLAWYRRHFRVVKAWGSVGWLAQGWSAVYELSGAPEQAALVYEVADWALARQLRKSGAFLEDLSPREPSFNTAFIAEGIAAALAIARRSRDDARADRYEDAWRAAVGFVSTLVIHPEDTFCLAAGERAVGGVRCTPSSSVVRIDQVSHTLNALASGLAAASR